MPNSADERFLEKAIHLAERHSRDGIHGPFGAVVTRGNVIVGEGWNSVVASSDPTAHAEIGAIRDACRNLGTHNLAECTLYSSCEPCPMCLAAIYWARIERIVFACNAADAARAGFDDAEIYQEIEKKWSLRKIASRQLNRESGLRVFETWIQNPRKVEY